MKSDYANTDVVSAPSAPSTISDVHHMAATPFLYNGRSQTCVFTFNCSGSEMLYFPAFVSALVIIFVEGGAG